MAKHVGLVSNDRIWGAKRTPARRSIGMNTLMKFRYSDSAPSHRLTRREADVAALVRSSAIISMTADIAADTLRLGFVTQATERTMEGLRRRRALIRPADSAGCSAMPGKTVTRSVVATTSQMAERVSISSLGARLKPASAAASSRIRRRP